MVADAKLGADAMEVCVSVISTILTSSARFSVYSDVLGSELEQLGLPKEHATALCRVYKEHGAAIRAKLATQVLRLSSLEESSCQRVDGASTSPGRKMVRLDVKVRDKVNGISTAHSVTMTPDQLATLLSEMKAAKKVMDSFGTEPHQ